MNIIIHCHPKYKHLESQFLTILENFDTSGETVALQERNIIKSFNMNGLKLNVKSFKRPNTFNSLIYKYVRPGKAKRSYEYANKLLDYGISTPFPIAYIENSSILGLESSFYISEHIDYDFEFRALIHKPNFPNRNEVLRAFTKFTFMMHENNVNFLDHSPGNTLIVRREGNYKFYLIDLNRMRFEDMTFNKRMHNFRRLWLSKAMVKVMASTYAKLYNKSQEETHNLMLSYSRKFQLKINSKKLRRSGRKMRFKMD